MNKTDVLSTENKIKFLTGADVWRTASDKDNAVAPVFFSDGPAGARTQGARGDSFGIGESMPATCFPAHSALARSWDKELCAEVGKAIGEEILYYGADVLLAPAVNIMRNPLCCRNFEYFSEDAYLSGKFGAAFISGVNSSGAAACVKHFAANNRERGRMVCDSAVDERTLREIYLTPFEIAVKEGKPDAVMTAYNRLNGVYCSENDWLIRGILRGEWGFGGLVVTDWGGTHDRARAVKAGCDLEMPRCAFSDGEVQSALSAGEISQSDIDACVGRIISLSEKRSKSVYPEKCDFAAHDNLCAKAAGECAVLLKNDGVLPLGKGVRFAVVGKYSKTPKTQGGGSSQVNCAKPANLESELAAVEGFLGCAAGGRRARALMKKADAVVVCLTAEDDTEGMDRRDIGFDKKSLALLNSAYSLGKPVICALFCGGARDTSFDEGASAAVLFGLSGQGAAKAVAGVLTGKINPSGKLAETFPYSPEDIPSTENFGKFPYGEVYAEGLKVGYRGCTRAKYPFGHGLSYARFDYSGLEIGADGVSFYICNSGDMRGTEIAQAYISLPENAFSPHMRLFGFIRADLAAGEKRKVFIPFDGYTFRSFDAENGEWVRVGGEYILKIGASCEDIRLTGKLRLDGTDGLPPHKTARDFAPYKLEFDKKGKVIARLSTPVKELTRCRGVMGRLIARLLLKSSKKGGAVGGTLEYLPLRTAAQFAGFNGAQTEGFLQIFNGKFFKGIFKIIGNKRG